MLSPGEGIQPFEGIPEPARLIVDSQDPLGRLPRRTQGGELSLPLGTFSQPFATGAVILQRIERIDPCQTLPGKLSDQLELFFGFLSAGPYATYDRADVFLPASTPF